MGRLYNLLSHLKTKDIVPVNIPVLDGKLLEGKNAIVIGGTGGIGEAIVETFIRNGCFVVATGTNEKKLNELKIKFTDKIKCFVINLKNMEEIKQKISEISSSLNNRIDILVNAAGVHGPASFWNVSEEDFDDVIGINLKSVFFTTKYVAEIMRSNNTKGHIVNITSASALKPGKTPYEISKNAMRSFTLGMATELIKYGIVVNAVAPGPVATKMLAKDDSSPLNWPGNPTGRISTPIEIANWVLLLASDLGNMVVGDSIYVSGGSGTICIDK